MSVNNKISLSSPEGFITSSNSIWPAAPALDVPVLFARWMRRLARLRFKPLKESPEKIAFFWRIRQAHRIWLGNRPRGRQRLVNEWMILVDKWIECIGSAGTCCNERKKRYAQGKPPHVGPSSTPYC